MGIKFFIFCIGALAINIWLISFLKKAKIFQKIYELSPESHQLKSSTPSFGGLGIIASVVLGLILFPLKSLAGWWCVSVFFVFCGIGFLDDFLSLRAGKNMGLSPRMKFFLQGVSAAILILFYKMVLYPISLPMAFFYWFLFVGASNATNLTDGLDGLLGGLSLITLWGFHYFFINAGSDIGEQLSIIFIVAVAAFLFFNRHPAKFFMGDTGSLGLGAFFAALSLYMHQPLILIPLGGVYIVETLSVMIQVSVFKRTKKRVFLMAPLHHHFEKKGYSEQHVVHLFWACSALLVLGYFLVFW